MKSIYKKWLSFIQDNYVYFVTILISYIVLAVTYAICKCFPYGNSFPLSGNGFIQDYPQFVHAVEGVKANGGVGILDYSVGLVFDNYTCRSYCFLFMILNPLFFLIFPLTPSDLYMSLFSSNPALYYLFSGLIFIFYLTHRRHGVPVEKKNPKLIVLGVAYSLSSFATCYYNYGGFRYLFFIPLVFLGIELLIYEKRPLLYIFSLSYYMASEAYYAFIMCIFIFLYFFILKHENWKKLIKNAIIIAIASIGAAGLAAAFLIPYFIRTRYSPYVADDSSLPSLLGWFENIVFPLSDFRALSEGVSTTPQDFRANIYCGIPALLLLPLFFTLKKIDRIEKIKKAVFLSIIYIAFDNELINYAFHGFHHQWQVPNRFAGFFIFVLLLMLNDILDELSDINNKKVFFTVFGSGVVLVIIYITSALSGRIQNVSISKVIPGIVCVSIYLLLSLIYLLYKKVNYKKIILIIMTIEVVCSAVYSLKIVLGFEGSYEVIEYSKKIQGFTELYDDMKTPFVITERPGTNDNQNLASVTNTHSISYYTSSSYSQELDLLHRWGLLVSTNLTYYTTGSPLADMMLHVKYHVTDTTDEFTTSPYPAIAQSGDLYLHENPYYLPLGIMIDRSAELDDWDENSNKYSSVFDRDNAFSNAFGLDNLYNSVDIKKIDSLDEAEDYTLNYYMVSEDETGGATFVFLIGTETSGNVYMSISTAIEFVGSATEDNCDTFYFYAPKALYNGIKEKTEFAALDSEVYSELYSFLSENVMFDQEYGSRTIKGKINTEKSGLLYMAMPYIPGFKAYIDGNETEIISYLDGIALEVSPGEHQIELRYTPEGMVIGIIITSIFAAVLCGYIFYQIKAKKEEKSKEDK